MCIYLSGIPCAHGIAAIWENQEDVEKYISRWYRKDTYMKAYEHQLHPINSKEQWPKTNLEPMGMPPNRAAPGRPKKLRRLELDELVPPRGTKMTRKYVVIKCSGCGEIGHNLKTCFRRQEEAKVNIF